MTGVQTCALPISSQCNVQCFFHNNYFTADLLIWQGFFALRQEIAVRIGVRRSGNWGSELPYNRGVGRGFYLLDGILFIDLT